MGLSDVGKTVGKMTGVCEIRELVGLSIGGCVIGELVRPEVEVGPCVGKLLRLTNGTVGKLLGACNVEILVGPVIGEDVDSTVGVCDVGELLLKTATGNSDIGEIVGSQVGA